MPSSLLLDGLGAGYFEANGPSGGERVRLCNPCVPDPNTAPPQSPASSAAASPRSSHQRSRSNHGSAYGVASAYAAPFPAGRGGDAYQHYSPRWRSVTMVSMSTAQSHCERQADRSVFRVLPPMEAQRARAPTKSGSARRITLPSNATLPGRPLARRHILVGAGTTRLARLHRRRRGIAPYRHRRRSPRRTSVLYVTGSCRRESCPTLRPSASRTLACASRRIAHMAALEPAVENRHPSRLRGGLACTRTRRRRRTALTMRSARYAWRSLPSGWPWLDWNVSAASTRRAFPHGSSITRADAPSISMTGLGSSARMHTIPPSDDDGEPLDGLWRFGGTERMRIHDYGVLGFRGLPVSWLSWLVDEQYSYLVRVTYAPCTLQRA